MDKGTSKEVNPLFSKEEKEAIVRKFITAYIGGTIGVSKLQESKFVSTQTMQLILTILGADQAPPVYIAKRTELAKQVLPDFNPKEHTDYSVEEAVDMLLYFIVAFRQGGLVTGKFIESVEVETQIPRIETTLDKVLATLQAIDEWQQRWEPTLNEAEKDYKEKLGHVNTQ